MPSLTEALTQDALESLDRDTLKAPFPADIGGGKGYDPAKYTPYGDWAEGGRVTRDDADVFVTSYEDLIIALEDLNGSGGGTIWLDTPQIDATHDNSGNNVLEDNITIASGRGLPNEPTCTFRVDKPDKFLKVMGDGCRLSGFEIAGAHPEYIDPREHPEWGKAGGDAIYAMGASEGIYIEGAQTEVDNVRVSGMTHAGIIVYRKGKASLTPSYRTVIHHADLVDNPTDTLGYGGTVSHGSPIFDKCFFDNNRHSIAADGAKDCHYVLSNSIVGPKGSSHAIDMHGRPQSDEQALPLDQEIPDDELRARREQADTSGVDHAGGRISIHHNIVMPVDRTSFKVRGCPRLGCQLHNNWWFNPPERPIPEELGQDDLVYWFLASGMSRNEVGISLANNHMDIGDPRGSIGTGFSLDSNVDEKLRSELESAKKEIQSLKPKADAAGEVAKGFSKLNQLFGSAGGESDKK